MKKLTAFVILLVLLMSSTFADEHFRSSIIMASYFAYVQGFGVTQSDDGSFIISAE